MQRWREERKDRERDGGRDGERNRDDTVLREVGRNGGLGQRG